MSSSGTEDEDLKAAIKMSLAATESECGSAPSTQTTTSITATPITNTTNTALNPNSAFNGLDRKAMEEERLARLSKKRERPISPPLLSRKSPKLEEKTVSLPSGAMLRSFSTVVNQAQQSRKPDPANAANKRMAAAPLSTSPIKQEATEEMHVESTDISQTTLQYPNGVVKKTWAYKFPRTGQDVKLEEVLEPSTVHTAVLSAFQWDAEWVLAKLKTPENGGKTKCVFIMQAESDELRQKLLDEAEPRQAYLRLCFPPMYAPIHCMHSKLMLLFHPHKLRIAIPTANLLNFDWGETGVMENSVFMIDLPRLPEGGKSETSERSPFAEDLLFFLQKQNVGRDIRDGVLNFDFTATQHMMFVHTAGGTHHDEEAERTGLPGLARAVRKLGLESRNDLQIDFAASSIGSLKDEFLLSVHAVARGEDLFEREKSASSKAKADFFKPALTKSPSEGVGIRDKVRIYFPTHNTVTSSIAGAAGTICLNRKWFEAGTFPRTCFRDYKSTRTGLLSHNKILFARGKKDVDGSVKNVAWAYVGSANMSESAWGKPTFVKKDKANKITCRNWECGVLLPVSEETLVKPTGNGKEKVKKEKVDGEDSETESEDEGVLQSDNEDIVGFEVFQDIVQPPFEVPGARYGGQNPWYFLEANV